jgi:hypothetical protein
MNQLSCSECRELAAELALGVLEGRERGLTLLHLSGCPPCQNYVSAMTGTVTGLIELLIELLPEVEPPPDFDRRIVAKLAPFPPGGSPARPPYSTSAAAILMTGALLLTTGSAVGRSSGAPLTEERTGPVATSQNGPALLVARLTSDQHQLGHAYLHTAQPAWVLVSVGDTHPRDTPVTDSRWDDTTADGVVHVALLGRDGSTIPATSVVVSEGAGQELTNLTTVDPCTVAGARLTTAQGRTLASGEFMASPSTSVRATAPHHHRHHHRHHHH